MMRQSKKTASEFARELETGYRESQRHAADSRARRLDRLAGVADHLIEEAEAKDLAERFAQRQKAFAELATIDADAGRTAERFAKDIAAAKAAEATAQEQYLAAGLRRSTLERERSLWNDAIGRRRTGLIVDIAAAVPQPIIEFREWIADELAKLDGKRPHMKSETIPPPIRGFRALGFDRDVWLSTGPSLRGRIEHLIRCREEADALIFQLPEDKLVAKIDELKAALPEWKYTELGGDPPLRGLEEGWPDYTSDAERGLDPAPLPDRLPVPFQPSSIE